jgi:mannose-6-phosphate isomerase-like protein (cupin superfamily)
MHTLSPLLQALADLTEAEPRPEARATADALRAAQGQEFPPTPPSILDAGIRALALSPSAHQVARLIHSSQNHLPWAASPASAQQPAYLARGKAVATLMDPEGPILSGDFRFGLFYQAPRVYYPLHAHEAAETYFILAGTAQWQAGDARLTLGPGDSIHHPPQVPHAMRAGPDGFLAFWRWSGDISFDSYQMLPNPQAPAT